MQPLKYEDQLTDHWKVSELCRPTDWVVLGDDQHLLDNIQRLAATVLEPLRVLDTPAEVEQARLIELCRRRTDNDPTPPKIDEP